MNRVFSEYKTLVFDCDGVILNSNHVKTGAFYKAALPYGEEAANSFVEYHRKNGGISRYKKFNYFLETMVPHIEGPTLNELLEVYAAEVLQGLVTCDIAEGLESLRIENPDSLWLVVSGGDQSELRQVFHDRGLDYLFSGGIFGSPDGKEEILAREIDSGKIAWPALFLGDSKYDYEAAQSASLDFLFLSGWSEVTDWQKWVENSNIKWMDCIASLNKEISKI